MSASMKAILHQILHYLFLFLSVYTLMHSVHCISDDITDYLLCRKCGHEIARGTDLTAVPSKLAHRQRNDTISGVKDVLIQLFQNPHAFNKRWNAVVGRRHPNLWYFLKKLKTEERSGALSVAAVRRGDRPPVRKRKYHLLQERIDRLTNSYRNGQRTLNQYWDVMLYTVAQFN